MPERQKAEEAGPGRVKAIRKVLLPLCVTVAAAVVLAAVLTHLGYYQASGSDVAIDLNSARLRTRSFFLWMEIGEKAQDTSVSRTLADAGIKPAGPPQWKLTSARSWPARVYPHFEFGKAGVSLTQAEIVLNDPSVRKEDKVRIADAFVSLLSNADLEGLEDLLRTETEKLNGARSP